MHSRPTTNDRNAWRNYWQVLGQLWRTEPEIDADRQKALSKCLESPLDIENGAYPFKGIELTRADIEWLLATQEHVHGASNWRDTNQQTFQGLDMRGANLSGLDLSGLPLAKMHGGLAASDWANSTLEQRDMAAVHMERTYLKETQLEGAYLARAHLERAYLGKAHLERAYLRVAHLEGADLAEAHLEGAYLSRAHMEQAFIRGAYLEGADLTEAHLEGSSLREAHLGGKLIREWDENSPTMLHPADLRGAYFDTATNLEGVRVGNDEQGYVQLADVRWGGVNLAVVDWMQVKMLGDEFKARQMKKHYREEKDRESQLYTYHAAVRANRQLTVVLRDQGLNEEANRFAYHAHILQRKVLQQQRKYLQYLGSWFLDLLAGYGYKPWRSVASYLAIIFGFMGLYLLNAHFSAPHLNWDEALVLSVSSFHGRGFFTQNITLGDTYARLAAAEAVVGLLIEISFIATFTQRFFGK